MFKHTINIYVEIGDKDTNHIKSNVPKPYRHAYDYR